MINHKIEDRISGNPPILQEILKQDPLLEAAKNELIEILDKNFDAVKRYCRRFDGIKQFYYEDTTFDEGILRDNRDCKLFREWSIRYRQELDLIDKIIAAQPLGIFFVQMERFKTTLAVAPSGKIGVIEAVLPG